MSLLVEADPPSECPGVCSTSKTRSPIRTCLPRPGRVSAVTGCNWTRSCFGHRADTRRQGRSPAAPAMLPSAGRCRRCRRCARGSRDEVQAQPVRGGTLHRGGSSSHAGIEDERIGRAAVPDEIRFVSTGQRAGSIRAPWTRSSARAPWRWTTTSSLSAASAARTDDADDPIRQAEPEVSRQLSGELVFDLVHRDPVAELARQRRDALVIDAARIISSNQRSSVFTLSARP